MTSIDSFKPLREKWGEVPAGKQRIKTSELLALDDDALFETWQRIHRDATTGGQFAARGWYHELYRDFLKGKKLLDVGSGCGIDGISFAKAGCRVSFLDIVRDNISLLERLCRLSAVSNVSFHYIDSIDDIGLLPFDYDVIWCQGSLLHIPFELSKRESALLLPHLRPNGRWIELAYPKTRWEREGFLPFSEWGKKTDGSGTPWAEWYDLEKLQARLSDSSFKVLLDYEYHNSDFIWFDLWRCAM